MLDSRDADSKKSSKEDDMRLSAILCLLLSASPVSAQTALKPPLQPLAFLLGDWQGDDGKVAETGGTSKGGSQFTAASDGWAILRQDHTELFDKTGKPAGGFHQTMIVYPDGSALRADYVDGEGHAIHYLSASVVPGKSVVFSSGTGAGPAFRLSYALQAPGVLTVTFGMTPPGEGAFHPIATGKLRKQNR
jgi:hypothetical protein